MTKPEPVCGALTHKKTPCQNTLVTGCGLCPVHASHLRASNPPFKQKPKPRRKKAYKISPALITPSPETHRRHPNSVSQTDPSLLPDHLLYNITPIQQPQTDFYQEHPEIHTLKNETNVLDMLKTDTLTLVSPVTPRASDSSLKAELFQAEQLREECDINTHSTPPENDLQASPDSYLLEDELPTDLSMPKFD